MSPKLKAPKPDPQKPKPSKPVVFDRRDGLGAYTHDPTAFPPSRVIYYDDNFVVINDLYPKSSIHTLLLPRSPRNTLHPLDAFEDPKFLSSVQTEVAKLKTLVAKELRRKYGKSSAKEKAREQALNGEIEVQELPVGRDWEKEVISGVHAVPSMNHLHVHVLSVDRFSEAMRHRKHYNSFNTPFLIDVDDFPLAEDDVRRHPTREGYLGNDLTCWRCGKDFGHKFAKLKEHLAEEFEKWKIE